MAYDFSVDFSPLAKLPQIARDTRMRAQSERTLADLASGGISEADAARQLIGSNPQAAMTLASLGNNQRDFQFRQAEAVRNQANLDRTYTATVEGQRVPPGFELAPGGGLQPKKGGPEDPAYLRQKTDATDKGRQMSITDITKLTEEGQKYGDLTRFQDTFKPEYAGYGSSALGTVANMAGRNLPEAVVGKNIAAGSTWWQGYDRYKNVVRNDLFGAALTANEQAAFDRADILPGMQPEQIKKNLTLQKAIVENGLKRKASAMVQAGYDPKAIGAAYGVDLGSIGVDANRAPKGAPAAASPPADQPAAPKSQSGLNENTVKAARANPAATLDEARAAIAAHPDKKDAIIRRLQQAGINPAGL